MYPIENFMDIFIGTFVSSKRGSENIGYSSYYRHVSIP